MASADPSPEIRKNEFRPLPRERRPRGARGPSPLPWDMNGVGAPFMGRKLRSDFRVRGLRSQRIQAALFRVNLSGAFCTKSAAPQGNARVSKISAFFESHGFAPAVSSAPQACRRRAVSHEIRPGVLIKTGRNMRESAGLENSDFFKPRNSALDGSAEARTKSSAPMIQSAFTSPERRKIRKRTMSIRESKNAPDAQIDVSRETSPKKRICQPFVRTPNAAGSYWSHFLRPTGFHLAEKCSSSASQASALPSLGARQSPRGLKDPPELIFGPLGTAERLNWLIVKKR